MPFWSIENGANKVQIRYKNKGDGTKMHKCLVTQM